MSNIDKQALRDSAESTINILENIAGFEPSDIDGDTVELRFETEDGFDTGCDVSIVDQCQKAADVVQALLDELEAKDKRLNEILTPNMLLPVIGDMDEDNLRHVIKTVSENYSLLHAKWESAEKRVAELESDNAYIKNRHKELDLLIGKNILVMQAAIIEWQGTGDARKGLAWIYNTLFGPGELPDESEKDAQAYFDRKYAPLDDELMNLHRWFWEQSEAERAAARVEEDGYDAMHKAMLTAAPQQEEK
ncbi:TPA: ead/Ea22-like family protein [Enterobacter hormaechei subsp. xiangfangensis]|nr:ead/Ea22-like family protein [Enterobacter hormaechei]MCU3302443.1 ead/Ea22-like family protein [Enterobacter hormaechei subsp. hoffmannii]DAG79467.1 MAG TPA: Ead/Ea22-like protein [Caudoviricetes sp.]HCM9116054.1 ead/Ea22-like family protein [Enterobacter hormaechei subsp. steigerwaltii]EHN8876415.1 ead/Ea22-like family protein [Enterobacter hormaechei]ELC6364665.1 ead/Ea22-like family protein [Enterobacter hormaechei]